MPASQGGRLPRPPLCGPALWGLIAACWSAAPAARPRFGALCIQLPLVAMTDTVCMRSRVGADVFVSPVYMSVYLFVCVFLCMLVFVWMDVTVCALVAGI